MPHRIVVAVVGLSLLGACGSGGQEAAKVARPHEAAYAGVCEVKSQAADPQVSRDVFFDSAHQPLHELASDAARRDRAASATLLEAKEAVEQDLDSGGGDLSGDIDRLLDATRIAIVAAGGPSPKPCKKSG